jgi:WD40 repeat protein
MGEGNGTAESVEPNHSRSGGVPRYSGCPRTGARRRAASILLSSYSSCMPHACLVRSAVGSVSSRSSYSCRPGCHIPYTCIMSRSDDETVRLWNVQTGNELAALDSPSDPVTSVALSPDGKHIASGSYDNTVRVWDAQTGEELAVLEGHSNWVRSVAFSPNGAHIVSGSDDETVRVWNAQTGKELAVLEGHSKGVLSVGLSPDGVHIVSGSSDNTVRVWDAKRGKDHTVLEGHNDVVWSVTFAPDGVHIVSGSSDRTVRVWICRQARSMLCSRATVIGCGPWHSRPTESTSCPVTPVTPSLCGT